MASLLKNQILKHLSKFTKNLSPDKLNVSAIKGEGEMSNLELDEEVLTDLLELPTWLKITRAFCNRVAVKIQWTKLKSQPICLYLDEVIVEMETCETPRTPSNSSGQSPLSQGGKYGFVDRVMDGIYVHVNSVLVKMRSHTFNASIQLSRVKVHSTSPNWVATNDLRTTRIRNTTVGEILLFKEIEWQTTRIEAAADESLPQELLTPLRLIANQAKIRIAVKKRLSDCSITSSRVILLLDDLLWVLTVTQLKAAMLYANSLKEVIERSTQQSKRLAAEKLKRQGNFGTSAPQKSQAQRPQAASNVSSADKLFTRFDVSTTSYHLVTSRFDLHLCDDTSSISDQKRHWDITGGSLQIVFFRLSVDFYPFHPAGGERKNWFRYSDNIGTRNPWVQKLFTAFREDAIKLRKVCGSPAPTPSSSATKISTTGATSAGSNNSTPSQSPSHTTNPSRSLQASPAHPATQQAGKTTRLLESCCVIKVEELTIYMVSTPNTKRTAHQKFLASDKKQLHLPPEMSILHMEYTDYYFPDGMNYPVPNANMYILVNPVRVTLDFPTLLWFQYFLYSLAHNVDIDLGERDLQEHIDIKLEALMPRIIVPAEEKVEAQPERPEAMQMQISKLTASNCRFCDKLTYDDLRKSLDKYYSGHLFHLGEFPCDSLPYRPTPWQLERHASHKDNPYVDKLVKTFLELDPNLLQRPDAGVTHSIHTNSLKMEAASDVWGLHLEQVWVEFLGVQNFRSRPVPCIEAFPLTLWLAISYANIPQNAETKTTLLGKSSEKSDLNSPPSCQQKRGSQQEDDTCDKRPSHLPLGDMESQDEQMTESFEDSRSLLSMDPDPHLQTTDSIFLLTNFAAKMRVQMNHFQYLFLSKMTESLTKFTEELAADLALWGSTRSFVTHIPLSFPDAELAIVCPYQMHQRTFSDDFSSSIPNMSDVFSVLGGGGGATAEDVAGGQTTLDNTQISQSFAKNNITSENLYLTNEYTTDDIIPLNNDRNTKPLNTFTSEELTGAAQIRNQTYLNGSQLYMSANQSLPTMGASAGNDSGIDLDRKSLQKNVKSGTKSADVKKVFSSAFSNISNLKDKLKSTFDDSQSLSDDVDSLSIRTDTSDDDDFEQLSLDDADEVPAFVHEGQSESGSIPDTYSDMDLSSIYAESSTTKGREMVCLILLKLDKSELVVQISDHGTVLSAQVSSIMIHQPGNVGYDEFYGKFSSSKGFLQDEIPPLDLPSAFPIKLKYMIPVVQPLSDTTLTETNMASVANIWSVSISVQDFSLLFKMSGIACLTDFFQTESVPQVVPMSVSVRNFLLVLNEDRPASNGASSGEVPMNCHIDQLLIKRGIDGVFYISGAGGQAADSSLCPDDTDTVEGRGPPTPSSSASFTMLMQTQTENSNLRRQCDELQRANKLFEEQVQQLREKLRTLELQQESKHHLHFQGKLGQMPQNTVIVTSELLITKETESENLKLQERLFALEEDLHTSNKEKESLITTLQFLQDELLRSERRGRCNTTS